MHRVCRTGRPTSRGGRSAVLAFVTAACLAGAALAQPQGLDWSGMWAPGRPPPGDKSPTAGGIFAEGMPLKPEIRATFARRNALVRGEGGPDAIPLSNSGNCIPSGQPEVMRQVSHEYLFSPGRVTILLENSEVRRIWTDGRNHPPDDESNPSFSGHSIGHWEGDTLVVDTAQIFPEAEYTFGLHVSDKTHIVERISKVGPKLKMDVVIDDPVNLTGPWGFTRWYDNERREPVDYERCTLGDRAKKLDGHLTGIDFNPNRLPHSDAK